MPELLGDEFGAVIEDADFRPDDAATFVKNSCTQVQLKKHPDPWKIGGVDCEAILRAFWSEENGLSTVLKGKKVSQNDGDQPKKPVESLAKMCSAMDTEAHERFAAVLAVRTQYQIKHRDLGFGTIIYDRKLQRYSVCIMPSCDALRLKDRTQFPFWRLQAKGKGNPVIVQCEDASLLSLVFEAGKPSTYLWMGSFAPDAGEELWRRTRTAVEDTSLSWKRRSTSG